jgi:hypothetical protein
MATSGTTSFNLDASDVIEEAYERCGIETRSGYDLKTAKRSLNLLLQEIQNRHKPLWKEVLTTQALVDGTSTYTLSSDIIDISNVVLRRAGVDTTITIIDQATYQAFPNKSTEGKPSQVYFEKLSTPKIHLYNTPENSTDTLRFYARERIEDVGGYDKELDVPINAIPVIISGLSYALAVKKAPERASDLKFIYDEELLRFKTEDASNASLYILPGGRVK